MTYSRDTTALSEITGQPVNTWSEEWQRECESRAVLKMSKAERDAFNGTKDENGKTIERGIFYLRGEKAAEDLRSLMQQSMDARATKR
jgi:predicted type IV restriction endonuclease